MPMKIPRVALVTGGMGGLGEAICIKLAALGYKVVTTHSPANTKAQEWLEGMNKMGYGFRAYPCDVADWDSCVACAQKVLSFYGLTLSDWQASSFILSTLTGKTEIVDNLTHLWAAAEKLIGRPCDPLDPRLIDRLEAGGG